MQCAVVEFCRNVLDFEDAASSEVNPESSHKVIDLMEDQKKLTNYGGTMRLGAYDCKLSKGSIAYEAYGKDLIQERHRHRYEVNSDYVKDFEKEGLVPTGINPKTGLVEIVELKDHPFFIGVQFHPELKSTVEEPHPLFMAFVKAASEHQKNKEVEISVEMN